MEPENKKEIMMGWWKFASLQLVAVLIISLIFFSANFYPDEIKKDYLKKSKSWKATKAKFNQARLDMEKLQILVKKYEDGGLSISEMDQAKALSSEINQKYTIATTKKAYHVMPNVYQELAIKYISKGEQLKKSGDCPELLKRAEDEVRRKDVENLKLTKELKDCYTSAPQ